MSVHSCEKGVLTATKVDGSVVGKGATAVTMSEEVEVVAYDTSVGNVPGDVGYCTATEEPSDGEEVSPTATADGEYASLTVIS